MALEEGMSTCFETREHPRFEFYRREISTSRNREMKELFDAGFGIHHAGMLRSDRNMMEKMFEDQAIKVGSADSGNLPFDSAEPSRSGALLYLDAGVGC
jgi:replicative superfamily II helicase